MKEQTEIESLKLTNAIQQKVIHERGEQLVEAIICLHKLVPIAMKAAHGTEKEAVDRALKFLHDER
jgi:hypothetical protein